MNRQARQHVYLCFLLFFVSVNLYDLFVACSSNREQRFRRETDCSRFPPLRKSTDTSVGAPTVGEWNTWTYIWVWNNFAWLFKCRILFLMIWTWLTLFMLICDIHQRLWIPLVCLEWTWTTQRDSRVSWFHLPLCYQYLSTFASFFSGSEREAGCVFLPPPRLVEDLWLSYRGPQQNEGLEANLHVEFSTLTNNCCWGETWPNAQNDCTQIQIMSFFEFGSTLLIFWGVGEVTKKMQDIYLFTIDTK